MSLWARMNKTKLQRQQTKMLQNEGFIPDTKTLRALQLDTPEAMDAAKRRAFPERYADDHDRSTVQTPRRQKGKRGRVPRVAAQSHHR